MTKRADQENAERLAHLTGEIVSSLPPGVAVAMFVFLVNEDDGSFTSTLAASTPPSVFAPVLRAWLERYDQGEASEPPIQ